jgi:hypothetical protein
MSLEKEIDNLAKSVVECDSTHCPDVQQRVSSGVQKTFQWKFPKKALEFSRCQKEAGDAHECRALLAKGLNASAPYFFDKCDAIRKETQENPMLGYNPIQYKSPFWFEGMGDLWRHSTYDAPKTNANACKLTEDAARTCATDPTKPPGYCQYVG